MAEPMTTTAAGAVTLAASAAAVPILSAFGIPLGLRADELLAGFAGAIAAIVLLNSVPASGDTWVELIRTSVRRVFVAVASALTAGYLVPVASSVAQLPMAADLFLCFVTGAGAQQMLKAAITREVKKVESAE